MKQNHAGILAFLFLTVVLCGSSSGGLELTKNGRSDFSVYVDASAPPSVLACADTLVRYIREISGARLPVVHETGTEGHRIVFEVGSSTDPGLKVQGLGDEGFRLKTDSGNLFISANTERGVRNALYTFLETYLGCRRYAPTVTVVPKRTTIILPDISTIPITVLPQSCSSRISGEDLMESVETLTTSIT